MFRLNVITKIVQMSSMIFTVCAFSMTLSAQTTTKATTKAKLLELHAEISLQEQKLCGRKEVNDTARSILGTAESLVSNSKTNLTVVKMHAHNCVSLAVAIREGRVTRISQPTIKKVMDEFCTVSSNWSFPEDGDACDETQYYK